MKDKMKDIIAPVPTHPTDIMPATGHVWHLIDLWTSQVAETSARSYRSTLADFAAHLDIALELAVGALLADRSRGHALALGYRAHLLSCRAPATVNVRLAALRSLVSQARTLGLIDWSLEVAGVRATPYRDTRGPGRQGFKALLQAAENTRDKAILRLLFGLALRVGEVVSLDVLHVQGDVLHVRGKGHRERSPVTMPAGVRAALAAWIEERGSEPGPLFLSQDRAHAPTRLSSRSIERMIATLATRAGLPHVRPHGLRHAGITEALELTRGDIRAVQRFSRHADPRTLLRYDDARTDMAGAVAALVDGTGDF